MENNQNFAQEIERIMWNTIVKDNADFQKKIRKLEKRNNFLRILALPTCIYISNKLIEYLFNRFFNKPTIEEQTEED